MKRKNIIFYIIMLSTLVILMFLGFLYINNKDNVKPVIKLKGELIQNMFTDDSYIEKGYIAFDDHDGNITNRVKISGKVNSNKPGAYKIRYEVLDSSSNFISVTRKVIVSEKTSKVTAINIDGLSYVNGILLVNKNHKLPVDYDPGPNAEAYNALEQMQADAKAIGLDLSLASGYRSYKAQERLYNSYVIKYGLEETNTFSAKPSYSEHQTGLAFDVGYTQRSFAYTDEAKWLDVNCHLYGFIIRYPYGKTEITGYIYEPWHVRYLGIDIATKVKESGLTLEEYLGTS